MNINDLPSASLQDIFEHIATHLIKQGKASFNGAICAYRGKDGYSCAIGCLIPDEEYSRKMEGGGVSELMAKFYPEINKEIDRDKQNLLIRMQNIHDYWNPVDWKDCIIKYAKERNLDTQFINNLVG